jgi:hypothetical protein
MMAVEAWLSYLNWTVIYGFERSLAWQFHGKREYAGPGTPPGACIIHRRYDPAHCGAVVALPQRQQSGLGPRRLNVPGEGGWAAAPPVALVLMCGCCAGGRGGAGRSCGCSPPATTCSRCSR